MMMRVERFGAGMETALVLKAIEKIARAKAEERTMRALLLQKRALSRGNWRGRAGTAEAEFRRPRQKGRKRHIREPALKHEQERYRYVLPVADREPDEVSEINAKGQLHAGQRRSKPCAPNRSAALQLMDAKARTSTQATNRQNSKRDGRWLRL